MTMTAASEFIVRHGEILLFLYVFADQVGIPVPAVPILLAAGALGGLGKLSFPAALAVSVVASLLADFIWYALGRLHGARVLRLLCKISLEPDSCVRRTEERFMRHGPRALLVSKFVPGLSTVAPPLAGVVGIGPARFASYSAMAAALWAGAWMALGFAAAGALEWVGGLTSHLATLAGAMLAIVIVAYVLGKWIQRRRFLATLNTDRITVDELKATLDRGESPLIIDLRTALDLQALPYAIPGARRVSPEELTTHGDKLPRDAEVVLYCS
jgi:membrane protein DedA with SNARE-associated domain